MKLKKLLIAGIACLGTLGLAMPVSTVFASGTMDTSAGYDDGSVSQGVKFRATVTNEECRKIGLDNVSGCEVEFVGRVVIITYEATSTSPSYQKKEKWYPASYERKSNLAINPDGTNPNEFNVSLQGFLKDLIGNDYTTGVSYESFNTYLNFLFEEHGMRKDEVEAWQYEYRVYNDCLTDEDKAKLEEEQKKAQEYLEQIKKEQEEAQKVQEEVANATSKKSLYEREAIMLERSLPDYVTFNAQLFISLRSAGYSYNSACEKSQTIDYSKAAEEIGKVAEQNKDWFDQTYKELQSEDVKSSFEAIKENIQGFVDELFGGNDGE